MRKALDMIHYIVTDGGSSQMNGHSSPITNGDSGIGLDNSQASTNRAIKDFEVWIETIFILNLCQAIAKNCL